jgi:NADPH-dependent 2,4-dienoyl-CoA reductase/sulfur reductase-like enzyme
MNETPHIAIVGGGPGGLAAAISAKRASSRHVTVFEREAVAGGIPRHCSHSPFGMREFSRIFRGPTYARRLVGQALAEGVEIKTNVTVIALKPGGGLVLATPEGLDEIIANRVILATGVRETPRAQRLVSGDRAAGILTTGALQCFTHLEGLRPFRRPVIIGSELVAFSALLTSRTAGILPVAMIEPEGRTIARWPSALLPRLLGVELLLGTRLIEIIGSERVEAVRVATPQGERRIACDGVLFTGEFTPAAELVRQSHLALDEKSGGPAVDQFGRCSDPAFFAAGNLLRPVETAGWCWAEGMRIGGNVARDLAGALPKADRGISISAGAGIKFVVPQRLDAAASEHGQLQLRVTRPIKGRLKLDGEGMAPIVRQIAARPERRILIPLGHVALPAQGSIRIDIEET